MRHSTEIRRKKPKPGVFIIYHIKVDTCAFLSVYFHFTDARLAALLGNLLYIIPAQSLPSGRAAPVAPVHSRRRWVHFPGRPWPPPYPPPDPWPCTRPAPGRRTALGGRPTRCARPSSGCRNPAPPARRMEYPARVRRRGTRCPAPIPCRRCDHVDYLGTVGWDGFRGEKVGKGRWEKGFRWV